MKTATSLNAYAGPRAVRDYLDPGKAPYAPLVEIPNALNPFRRRGVRIFAKLMGALPLHNSKSLPALNMLLQAEKTGALEGVTRMVENSSGNTVFSLAILGRLFGINTTKAFVSHEVSPGKLKLLRFFGASPEINREPICPNPGDPDSGICKARREGARRGALNPGQYDNPANPGAHERWTGPQIWEQTGGNISIFCAGLGTTGTMIGAGGYLKKRRKDIINIGAVRKPNNPVPGVRTKSLLAHIAFDWNADIDSLQEVAARESYEKSLELSRAGLVAGPSSGFAYAGLLHYLSAAARDGRLRRMRRRDGEIIAVFLCPDTPYPYIDEYFEQLGAAHFPAIANEHLLAHAKTKKTDAPDALRGREDDVSVSCTAMYRKIFAENPRALKKRLERGETPATRPGTAILDVRSPWEYADYHIPASQNIQLHSLMKRPAALARQWKGRAVFVVCARGAKSVLAAHFLRRRGIRAYSLSGGAQEWSALDLPRVRPAACVKQP